MDSPAGHETENTAWREKTDEELVVICAANREAFGELARRYQSMAYRAALSLLRSEPDAADHVQTAFCKAFEHMPRFRREARFSTWLIRIVVNECLMHLRRAAHLKVLSFGELGDADQSYELPDQSRSVESQVSSLFLAQLLEREIRRMPRLLRDVFVLRDVEQRPMPEVAHRLGVSVPAAKSRLSRAREELRKRMEPHLSTPPRGLSQTRTNRRNLLRKEPI